MPANSTSNEFVPREVPTANQERPTEVSSSTRITSAKKGKFVAIGCSIAPDIQKVLQNSLRKREKM